MALLSLREFRLFDSGRITNRTLINKFYSLHVLYWEMIICWGLHHLAKYTHINKNEFDKKRLM